MKIGSLFAGIGGIELGFKKAGFKTAWAVELDSKACITYKANHKHKIINNDLAKVDLKNLSKIDILTAGFPCQAFSVAGYRKGFKDERGNVFFEILRYLEHFKPSIIFLENVKNLFKHDKGRTFEIIKKELQKLGYFLKYEILNTSEYGNIPQNRERIYIIGFLDFHTYESFHFPAKIKLTQKIENLLEQGVDKSFYYTSHKYYPQLKKDMQSKETLYQWRRHYVRENKNKLCPTLTANMGTGGLISFKDRDRGGQGIDYKHQSNQGKRITSKDCDIYAAVDKQVGICYLIPMSFADSFDDEKCAKVKLEQIKKYKENWDIIKQIASKKLP